MILLFVGGTADGQWRFVPDELYHGYLVAVEKVDRAVFDDLLPTEIADISRDSYRKVSLSWGDVRVGDIMLLNGIRESSILPILIGGYRKTNDSSH